MQLPLSGLRLTRPAVRVAIAFLMMGPYPATAASPLQEFSDELQDLVARVTPSVVQVLTTGVSSTGEILSSSGDLLPSTGEALVSSSTPKGTSSPTPMSWRAPAGSRCCCRRQRRGLPS